MSKTNDEDPYKAANGDVEFVKRANSVEIMDDDDMDCEQIDKETDSDDDSEPEVYVDEDIIVISSDSDSDEEELEDEDDELASVQEVLSHEDDDEVTILENKQQHDPSAANASAPASSSVTGASTSSTESRVPNKERANVKKEEGNRHYSKEDYHSALALYTEAIGLCPPCEQCAAIYSNRAAALIMLGRYKEALEDCKLCVRLRPDFAKVHVRLAKCYLSLGDITSAELSLQRVAELDPNNHQLKHEGHVVQLAHKLCEDAQTAYDKGDYRKVLYCMERVLEHCTACTRFRLWKAECLARLRRYAEAQDIANTILQFESSNVDALYVRGYCLYYQDHIDKAFLHFQHALRLAPDHDKTMAIYKKAKQLKQKKEQGNELFKVGKMSDALAVYTDALKIDENNVYTNAKLYCNRATIRIKMKKYEDAISDCNEAIRLDDKYIKAYIKRAACHTHTEDYEAAVKDYETVYKFDKTREHRDYLENAKFELKKSKRKNYYKILGVGKDATDADIKKAYKKRALMHHPHHQHSISYSTRRTIHIVLISWQDLSYGQNETVVEHQSKCQYRTLLQLMEGFTDFISSFITFDLSISDFIWRAEVMSAVIPKN